MQVPNTEGKGTEDVVIEGKVGTSYTTKPAENVQQNYELIATPTNANGCNNRRTNSSNILL